MRGSAQAGDINIAEPSDLCVADGCQAKAELRIRLPLIGGSAVVLSICRKCRPLFPSAEVER